MVERLLESLTNYRKENIVIKKEERRKENLLPAGSPRYVRIYDNGGKTYDRYTVVFTRPEKFGMKGQTIFVGMSHDPFYPQGFCQHGALDKPIDRPSYGHIGKKIGFDALPEDCRKVVINDYQCFWGLRP